MEAIELSVWDLDGGEVSQDRCCRVLKKMLLDLIQACLSVLISRFFNCF